ncbi:twin-arginine translocase TatA/TatE family subunit [Dehalogenimonas sp. THU2]|uniref:Sec-independent protein translocase subunit TatA/TatB n=1 Tax=Dehalogenimonas sp. THU2 TaxID=3151121 RepID=UPI003218CF03
MNFFGMGTFEIITILVIATLVFGPNRIPEFAKKAGEFVRSFRKITTEMTKEFTKAIDSSPTKSTGKAPSTSSSPSLDKFLSGSDKK